MIFCNILVTGIETRLWNYVANFSTLSGKRLTSIYKKLKEDDSSNGGGWDGDSSGGYFPDDGVSSKRIQNFDGDSVWDTENGQWEAETWKHGSRDTNLFSEEIANQGNVYSRRRDAQPGAVEGQDTFLSSYMQASGGNWVRNGRKAKWRGDERGPNFGDGYDM